MTETSRIGFVGLGNMGQPMATCIAKAGKQPVVYDLRADAMATPVSHGASAADSLPELIRK